MAEAIIDLPDNLDGETIDENLLREALDALAKKKASQAKAKERRAKMTPEEKLEAAQAAKKRRAIVQLKVNYADKNGYRPSDDEVNAFLAAQDD